MKKKLYTSILILYYIKLSYLNVPSVENSPFTKHDQIEKIDYIKWFNLD